MIPDHTTVGAAREWITTRLPEGVDCPCCGQRAASYKRSVSKAMVRTMAKLLREQQRTPPWVHLASIPQRSRDVATCAYFGLIEEDPHRRGWWRVTDSGAEFLRGGVGIWKHAHVFNGKVLGYSGHPYVKVFDVDARFDLERMLRGEER